MDNSNAEENYFLPTENQELRIRIGVRKQQEDEDSEIREEIGPKRRKTLVNFHDNLPTSNDKTNEQINKINHDTCEDPAQFLKQGSLDKIYEMPHKSDVACDFQEKELKSSEIDSPFKTLHIPQEEGIYEKFAAQEESVASQNSQAETDIDVDLSTDRNNAPTMLPQPLTLKQLQREIQCKNEELEQMKKEHGIAVKQFQLELESKDKDIVKLKDDYNLTVKYLERSLQQAVLDSSSHKVNCLFEEVLRTFLKVECGGSSITTAVPTREQIKLVKTCRLVCKSWREIVDRILEPNLNLLPSYMHLKLGKLQSYSGPHPLIIQFPTQNWSVLQWIRYHLQIWETNKIDSSPYNPLPTRHIFLDIKDTSFTRAHLSGLVTNFMKTFGIHIWNLTVLCHHTPEEDTIQALNCWFQQLPLLKSLTIDFPQVSNNHPNDLQFRSMFDLQKFQFRGQMSIFHEIIGNNPSIRKLHLDCLTLYTSNDWNLINSKLSDLLELSLNIYESNQMLSLETDNWKIETLAVQFPQRLSESTSNLFKFLEMFRNNLTTLKLDCRLVKFTSPTTAYLNLPNVKSLSLIQKGWKNFPLKSFLSEMKAIESLSIKLFCCDKRTHNAVGYYIASLTQESLCQILAKLKNFKISRKCIHHCKRWWTCRTLRNA